MERRGHDAATAQCMDENAGAIIYHQYRHGKTCWENGISITDPVQETQPASDANWKDLEKWSRNA